MKALITGLSGQDGSYLAEQLLADGVEVHGLVRTPARPPFVPEAVRLHVGDVMDHAATARLVEATGPDVVFNLAAISSVARSWAEPDLVRAVNADAAIALLRAAVDTGARFVQASSAEVFGEPTESPQNEGTPIAPTNPYGEAKAAAHLAVAKARKEGAFAVNAILYNHESPRRPTTFVTRKITSTVAAIARREADEVVLGNLDVRRDWGWAPDHVDALVRASRHEVAADYVVATGVAHSIRDLVDAAFARIGIIDWSPYVRIDEAFVRPNDAPELLGDASRARRDLGWAPTKLFSEVISAMVDADLT